MGADVHFFALAQELICKSHFFSRPFVIGIDGADGSGKTIYASKLFDAFQSLGEDVCLISVDHFLRAPEVRNDEKDSWLYYFENAFDLYEVHREIHHVNVPFIIVEGVYLQREPLKEALSFCIFLDVNQEEILNRVEKRDKVLFKDVSKRYCRKYFPAFNHYLKEFSPIDSSDLIIDNQFFERKRLMKVFDAAHKHDAVVFDLDGTLWNSAEACLKEWNGIFEKRGLELVSLDLFKSCIGLPLEEFHRYLFPKMNRDDWMSLIPELRRVDLKAAESAIKFLYPYVIETLHRLSFKYPLAIVSNCSRPYMNAFLDSTGLEHLFIETHCFGDHSIPKKDMLYSLKQRFSWNDPVYIGDTSWDFDAAYLSHYTFIGVSWGYGTFSTSPEISMVNQLGDLLNILQ